jgi:glycerol-3-phosphate acyltransferase PlsY
VYIGFRGGRGEAATIGILIVLLTIPMLILTVPTMATLIFKEERNPDQRRSVYPPLWLVSILWGAPASLIAYSIALPCLVASTHFLRTRRGTHTDVEADCAVSEDATEARRNYSCK